jgi:hypothetical protein
MKDTIPRENEHLNRHHQVHVRHVNQVQLVKRIVWHTTTKIGSLRSQLRQNEDEMMRAVNRVLGKLAGKMPSWAREFSWMMQHHPWVLGLSDDMTIQTTKQANELVTGGCYPSFLIVTRMGVASKSTPTHETPCENQWIYEMTRTQYHDPTYRICARKFVYTGISKIWLLW